VHVTTPDDRETNVGRYNYRQIWYYLEPTYCALTIPHNTTIIPLNRLNIVERGDGIILHHEMPWRHQRVVTAQNYKANSSFIHILIWLDWTGFMSLVKHTHFPLILYIHVLGVISRTRTIQGVHNETSRFYHIFKK
jgi:hypothetical protein